MARLFLELNLSLGKNTKQKLAKARNQVVMICKTENVRPRQEVKHIRQITMGRLRFTIGRVEDAVEDGALVESPGPFEPSQLAEMPHR